MEHMRLLYLGWTLLPSASWPLVYLTLSSPPGNFQPAPPSALSLSHFFFHQLSCRIFCIHSQCSLLYYLSTLFSLDTICLHSFASSYLPVLFPFKSSFQYLRYPPLRASSISRFSLLLHSLSSSFSALIFIMFNSSIISKGALLCDT